MKSPYKTHAGMEMIIAESDFDGNANAYAKWLNARFPSLKVTVKHRQSGGSGLFLNDGSLSEYTNWYWDQFCKQ